MRWPDTLFRLTHLTFVALPSRPTAHYHPAAVYNRSTRSTRSINARINFLLRALLKILICFSSFIRYLERSILYSYKTLFFVT